MISPLRLLILLSILALLAVGLFDFLRNFESNNCEMTYMYQQPQYLRIPLDEAVEKKFPKYSLYFYGEGEYAQQSQKSGFRLSGIPVLFIPGNAGSYRQVRSLGSVALRKADDTQTSFHFNYFSADFKGEFSGLSGNLLFEETKFTHECIKKILTMYKGAASPPKSVVIVGHSMGGMVARGLFTLTDFKPALVNTIITQATPHQMAPIIIDPQMHEFYETVNNFWREKINTTVADVTVFSSAGGYRDILVRSGLTALNGIVKGDRSISSNTMSMPRAWASTDHLCHVWCKQVVLATKRAMFDIVDKSTKQIAVSPFYRWSAFLHHFHKNPGPKTFKGAYDKMTDLNKSIKWEIRKKLSWKFWTKSLPKTRYSVTQMPYSPVPPEYAVPEWGYVAISNIENEKWLGTCSTREKMDPKKPLKKKDKPAEEKQCTEVNNYGPFADLLPPFGSEKKVVHLDHEVLKDTTHIVSILPKTKKRVEIYSELYRLEERNLEYNTTGMLDFLCTFPRYIMESDVIINSTAPEAIFYNISLNFFEIPLQAYSAELQTIQCTEDPPVSTTSAVMKLHVPWSHDHTYSSVRSGKNGSLSLKLMTPKPANIDSPAQLHLYLLPTCTYRLTIGISWKELFGQFIRFYGLNIPGFMVIQILMVLSWQLKMMDEQGHAPSFGVSHARWAQPYRVVPVSLLLRFMLYFPEEDCIAMKFGLPVDDRTTLEKLGMFYSALPIMLYLSTYVVIGLYGPMVHLLLSFAGKVYGSLFRCLLYPSVQTALTRCQYLLYIIAAVLAATVCGTLGIFIVYSVTVLKTIGLSMLARSEAKPTEETWSRFHVHTSLVILLLASLVLNGPALLTWATDIDYSPVLVVDPSRTIGVVISVTALLLAWLRFPSYAGEMYGIGSALLYIICVLMVLYTTVSVYRITSFVYSALIIITTCALLSVWMESGRDMEQPRGKPAETPVENPTEKSAEEEETAEKSKD